MHAQIYIHRALIANEVQEGNKACSITHVRPLATERALLPPRTSLHIRFPSWTHTHTHACMRTRGESIYQQHAHVCMYTYKLAYARARNKARGRGHLVSAQLWRHPSRARILQASRDQPGQSTAPRPPEPMHAGREPPVARSGGWLWLHHQGEGRICLPACDHTLARAAYARCLEPAARPRSRFASSVANSTAAARPVPSGLSLEQIKPASPANGCPSRRLRAAAPSHMPRV